MGVLVVGIGMCGSIMVRLIILNAFPERPENPTSNPMS